MTNRLDPPANLDDTSKQIWRDTVTAILEAGTITHLNIPSLAAYVAAVRNHQRATAIINADDDLLTEQNGKIIPNPALTVQTMAATTISTFARQFRLNTGPAPEPAPQPQQPMQPTGHERPGRWCDEHRRYDCTGHRKDGTDCHGPAETGRSTCRMHRGGTGARAVALAQKLVREPTYGTAVRVTAEQALVGELWRTAGHVKWLGERVAELESAALTWGTTQTATRYWGEFPGAEVVQKSGPHVLLDLYDRERKHLVHTASEIIRAGLAQRLLTQAQEQGAAVAKLLDLIFRDLSLSAEACEHCGVPAQQALVPVVVPARLRELMPA